MLLSKTTFRHPAVAHGRSTTTTKPTTPVRVYSSSHNIYLYDAAFSPPSSPPAEKSVMMKFLPIDQFAAVCKQYVPGQLPYANRRDVGAGYAMATAAVVAAVTFILAGQIPGLSEVTTIGPFWFGYLGILSGSTAVMYAAVTIPIIIPSAFMSGIVVWRSALPNCSRFGLVAGVTATALSYLFGTLAVCVVLVVSGAFE